jgi:hypothetical protein
MDKCYSLLGLIASNKGKKFDNIDTWCQHYKTFYIRDLQMFLISWSVCPWQAFLTNLMFVSKAGVYLSEALFKCSALGKAPDQTHKY